MSRGTGNLQRILSRIFKERQIYHRSDGVVHFISMSAKTQIALAGVVLAAVLWVAYASVNFIFKEQIVAATQRDKRVLETTYNKRLYDAQKAYDDVNSLNYVIQNEFDRAMAEISTRHEMLRDMVERKSAIDQRINELAESLSTAGGPNGQKPVNGNRVMINVLPAEPTPRQSRLSELRKEAAVETRARQAAAANNEVAADAMQTMEAAAADLYAEQMLLAARLEEKTQAQIKRLHRVLASTGVAAERLITPAKIANTALAQGGPFIDAADMFGQSKTFFIHANRAALAIDELEAVQAVVNRVPLSSPLTVSRRFTSGYGVRRDPFTGRPAGHYGIDFAAAWASPVTATADGVVKFAGRRSGFGRVVEIDHGNGFVTRYAHLNRISVKAGQKVKLHDKVGELGSSGRSTGAHVHYEIHYKKRPINPLRFIEAGRYVFES